MLKKTSINKVLFFVLISVCSFGLSRAGLLSVKGVFLYPFILFCFLIDIKAGVFSGIVSFLFLIWDSWWFLITCLFMVMFLVCAKKIYVSSRIKFEFVLSIFCMFLTAFESVFIGDLKLIYILFLSVVSYWVMRYFYRFYMVILGDNKDGVSCEINVFFCIILGLVFYGLKLDFFCVNLSFIAMILLAFLLGRCSFNFGVTYSFLIAFYLYSEGFLSEGIILFLCSSLLAFFLRTTSKITFLFCYALGLIFLMYYLGLEYADSVSYLVAALLYFCMPSKFLFKLESVCVDNVKYINNLMKERDDFVKEISSKISSIKEALSLFFLKLNKARIRKNEKELLSNEISVVEDFLKVICDDIKKDNLSKLIEKELYKYNLDLINCCLNSDVLSDKKMKIIIRCSKSDVKNIVIPIASKFSCGELVLESIFYNYIYSIYTLSFKSKKKVSFNYSVSTAAKDGVSGDSYLIFKEGCKQYFCVSDGMGSGVVARDKSRRLLGLFKKFINLGMSEEQTLKSINYILKNDDEKESYATLDLLVYNGEDDSFYFYKNGACDSYVFNGENLSVIEGDNLPVGIVDKIGVISKKISVNDGDYIIMASDGVSEKMIYKIKNFNFKDVNKISRNILKGENVIDDQSIMVIKIIKC